MIITTKQHLIENVARHWRENYYSSRAGVPHWYDENKQSIYNRLMQLINPAEADITAVIGNGSWTRLVCDQCKREVEAVIQVGEEPDIESHTANLCFDCLRQAVAMVEEHFSL